MKKLFKLISGLIKLVGFLGVVLFVIYFFNLDQKLLGWAYVQVNKIFDKKKVDIKF